MALGTFLLTQGLRGTVPVIALSVRVFKERARIGERGESDRNTEKVTMAGAIYASVTWFSMTAGGAKLLHDGYKGLTEEEISNTDRAQD